MIRKLLPFFKHMNEFIRDSVATHMQSTFLSSLSLFSYEADGI